MLFGPSVASLKFGNFYRSSGEGKLEIWQHNVLVPHGKSELELCGAKTFEQAWPAVPFQVCDWPAWFLYTVISWTPKIVPSSVPWSGRLALTCYLIEEDS